MPPAQVERLVLDPNALVSGIAGIRAGAPPALLIRAMQAMQFEIVVCPEIVREVRKALRKPYFRERGAPRRGARPCSAFGRSQSR